MTRKERNAIWHVLETLLIEGEEWVSQHLSKETSEAVTRFEPLKKWGLDSYRQRPSGAFKPGEGIRLKPPEREVGMSALWCKWDLGGVNRGCWFYLGMWLCSGQFVAFRFEPPGGEGNHRYYHSQPCRTMGWQGDPVYGDALAVPERNPTWPLPAASSLELLLCVVVSIRGVDGFNKLRERIEEDAGTRGNRKLNKALDRIASLWARSTH